MLKLVSLASGSKGNATLILSDKSALLCDAGISYSHLSRELDALGLKPSMLDGVVITHEHIDHIKALPKLAEDCKIYAHPLTARAIYLRQGALKNAANVDNYEGGFSVGDINVEPFRIPHDAEYPLAYSFSSDGARCSIATDIGVPTLGVLRNIKDSEVVLLEANHDITMLKEGNYPPPLKARILSDKGHLSNDAAARIVKRLVGQSKVKTLLLGHISENNNTEECAFNTIKNALESMSDKAISLHIAHQNRKSEVFEIK
ncbi:MAG: MBL fold metallo-hydrolase [Bacteroides sp.]|nr:MBL fold metallo-hydrolase [Bacillota bacterium]MCM1394097.1 MBL fold metallo-hydrolase [[Eubacterium] siraeum]MCM1455890.1 MBL fold metallo-hydrolase [Bacteroides sp.]